MKIFLDDYRIPLDCVSYMHQRIGKLNPIYLEEWKVVKNYNEFTQFVTQAIESGKEITHVSFDHDLADSNSEIWKDVVGYEGIYQVSSLGHVNRISIEKGTSGGILKPNKSLSGLYVRLRNKGNDNSFYIHRLVMLSFYGLNPDKPYVNHKDGNRWNNKIDNLEWCTNSENVQHSHNYLDRNFTSYGESHGNSKTISQYTTENELIDVWGSVNEAGRQLNIPFTNIAKCARGERHSAGGYLWKYENKLITKKASIKHKVKNSDDYMERFFIPEISKEKTGLDCARWFKDLYTEKNKQLPTIFVHSMNPVGTQNIINIFKDK